MKGHFHYNSCSCASVAYFTRYARHQYSHSLINPQTRNPPKTSVSGPDFNYAGNRRTVSEILLTDFLGAPEYGLNCLQLNMDDRHTDAGIWGHGICERAVLACSRTSAPYPRLLRCPRKCCWVHVKCRSS